MIRLQYEFVNPEQAEYFWSLYVQCHEICDHSPSPRFLLKVLQFARLSHKCDSNSLYLYQFTVTNATDDESLIVRLLADFSLVLQYSTLALLTTLSQRCE
jgi:hypothetical protein